MPQHRWASPNRFPFSLLTSRRSALILAFLLTATSAGATGAAGATGTCIVDREALLELDQNAFDQDMEGGWRPVANRPECRGEAADLIAEYRQRRIDSGADDSDLSILYWHEGQLRAMDDDSEAAATLFEASYSPGDDPTWVHYAEASIALEGVGTTMRCLSV